MRLRLVAAFTLVDLLLVMGLVVLLLSFSSLNFLRLINKPSLDSAVQRLTADIKGTQNQAMVGDSGSAVSTTTWGVYIEAGRYTIFRGATYVMGDASNFVINMDQGIGLSTTFSLNSLVFARRSGEVANFSGSANTITVNNTSSGQSKTITVNSLGVVTVN